MSFIYFIIFIIINLTDLVVIQWTVLPQGINNSSTHATDEIPISLGEPENINGGQVRTSGSGSMLSLFSSIIFIF